MCVLDKKQNTINGLEQIIPFGLFEMVKLKKQNLTNKQ